MIRHRNTSHATSTVKAALKRVKVKADVRTLPQRDGSLLTKAVVTIATPATLELALQALRSAGFDDVAPANITGKSATVYARSWLPEGKR